MFYPLPKTIKFGVHKEKNNQIIAWVIAYPGQFYRLHLSLD